MSISALNAFEESIRNDPERKLIAEHYLKKLESVDPDNPEFLNKLIDREWQVFLKGWNAAKEDKVKQKEVVVLYSQ